MARARQPVDLESLLERAETLVRSHGAVPKAEMKSFRPHLAELSPRLVERGFEVGSTIRTPLATQLVDLAENGSLSAKGLERKLSGATAREVKTVLASLVATGQLVEVARAAGVAFASPSAAMLDERELRELLAHLTKVAKLLKAASRAKRRVLREDVGRFAPDAAGTAPHVGSPAEAAVVEEIARRVRATPTPTHVPALLRSMGLTAETGRRALLDGAARGLFELEPESGMGRLSRDDAALCPRGPMGTHLSWIRARVQEGAR